MSRIAVARSAVLALITAAADQPRKMPATTLASPASSSTDTSEVR